MKADRVRKIYQTKIPKCHKNLQQGKNFCNYPSYARKGVYDRTCRVSGGALFPNTMTMVIGKRRFIYVQLLAQTSSSEVCSKANGMKADIDQRRSSHSHSIKKSIELTA